MREAPTCFESATSDQLLAGSRCSAVIDATANEADERGAVRALVDAKVVMRDLKIAVYGESAVVTFHGDFSGKLGGKALAFTQACTIVFLKLKGDWKIVHEHFSLLG